MTSIGKKGSLVDPIFGGAYLLKIAITVFIVVLIWVGFSEVMGNVIEGGPSESVLDPVIDSLTGIYYSIDYMIPFIIGALMLVSIISAFKVGSNILWGIISFLFWVIGWLMSTVFVNVYLTVTNELPDLYVNFPIMDMLMVNLRWIVLVWAAFICVVMFRKDNREDDSSEIQRRAYGV